MAVAMTQAEIRTFLTTGTRTAKLAVVGSDGAARVVPVWFVLDGDDLVFTTGHDSVKAKAMRRDSRVCLVVDAETPPYAFVQVNGTVTMSQTMDEMLRLATAIGRRYMGIDRAKEFGLRNAVPEEVLVRVTPTKIVALADVSG
jgi:PPOX class probable F420-dependent enzyme